MPFTMVRLLPAETSIAMLIAPTLTPQVVSSLDTSVVTVPSGSRCLPTSS